MSPKNTQAPPTDSRSPSLFDAPRAGSNLPEYKVCELSRKVKQTIEQAYGRVRVRAEIGGCTRPSSGHLYISLKDENAVLEAVCWRGQVSRLGIRPETGMEVVCTGKLTTYAGQSKYQLQIEQMALAGEGALLKLLEERRKKLAAEGLFDASRKKDLPFLPQIIGVVTSPTGAVIQDILHRLQDRFPRRVLLWPVPVQGEAAASQIAAALRGFNALKIDGKKLRPDLLILARGGGSLEDLMPFNEEEVIRAVAESDIPVISAVGHETDTTLVDYASDVRAPTPSAAAEMAVPVRAALVEAVAQMDGRLSSAVHRGFADRRQRLDLLSRALGDPARAIAPLMQRLDERSERLDLAWKSFMTRTHHRLMQASGRLRHPRDLLNLAVQRLQNQAEKLRSLGREKLLQTEKKLERLDTLLQALSPRAVLGRGYGLIYDAKGQLLTRGKALKKGDKISFELQDGSRGAVVED